MDLSTKFELRPLTIFLSSKYHHKSNNKNSPLHQQQSLSFQRNMISQGNKETKQTNKHIWIEEKKGKTKHNKHVNSLQI